MIDNVKENVVEAEGVVEGEAEASPGVAVVAPLEAEVVAGGEDTGGRGNACDKPSPPVSETTALGRMIQNCLRAPRAIEGESNTLTQYKYIFSRTMHHEEYYIYRFYCSISCISD